MSSVLTALGVPGGTAASTFDDAYLDELSRSVTNRNNTLDETFVQKANVIFKSTQNMNKRTW